MRSGGSSANEIAAAGGGMASTVTVTRGTDPWTLCNGVRARLRQWLLAGTTTIEAKTGYHLTRDGELADVRLLRSLEGEPGMPRVHVTFLAAHAVPPEYFGRRHDYVDAVGAWCADAAAAGRRQRRRLLRRGPLHRAGGALGARRGPRRRAAAPAARLRRVAHRRGPARRRDGLRVGATCCTRPTTTTSTALAPAGVAAVLCPGTALETGTTPPVRALLDKGVAVALGSDHAPGGNGITSMPLVISLAVGALRDERHRGAARGHARRRPGAARPRPRRDGAAAGTPTSWPGTPTTRARSPGPTASSRSGSGAAASPSLS